LGTTYYFSVKAQNGAGLFSSSTTSNGQCVVSNAVPPAVLTISNISVTNITAASAVISWNTDRMAISHVEYGLSAAYTGTSELNSQYNTSHSITITGLKENTRYHYIVVCKDSNDATYSSGDNVFTTLEGSGPANPNIHAYPNPFKMSAANPVKFRIPGGAEGAPGDVSIYTVSGRLIKKLSSSGTGASIEWDGTNTDGEKLARGIYLYKITSSSGISVTGKLALTK